MPLASIMRPEKPRRLTPEGLNVAVGLSETRFAEPPNRLLLRPLAPSKGRVTVISTVPSLI